MNRAVKQRRVAGVMELVGDQFFDIEGRQSVAGNGALVRRISEARHAAVRKATLLEVELIRRGEEVESLRSELRACRVELDDLANSATGRISDLNFQLSYVHHRCRRYFSALVTLVDAVGRDRDVGAVLGD